jgi:hypothetical protein
MYPGRSATTRVRVLWRRVVSVVTVTMLLMGLLVRLTTSAFATRRFWRPILAVVSVCVLMTVAITSVGADRPTKSAIQTVTIERVAKVATTVKLRTAADRTLNLVSAVSPDATVTLSSTILPGFHSKTLPANDDGSTGVTNLPFPIDFFGQSYSHLYVNNNGNVTFTAPLGQYTPESLAQIGVPMIAPFWADVDTRVGPVVTYGGGTVNGHTAFGVNWIGVGCYSMIDAVTDSFQLVLIDRNDVDPGDFDIEFNYGPMSWDSGQASGGNSRCLGGTAARAGYTNGHGTTYELPGSGIDGGLLDTNFSTGLLFGSANSGVNGRYIYSVRGAGVPTAPAYVALGDSYSSGQGTYDFPWAGSPCDQGPEAWPVQMANMYSAVPPIYAVSMFACSGATTQDLLVTGQGGNPSQITQLKGFEAKGGDPSLVTVTIGGDNSGIGFAPLLASCVEDGLASPAPEDGLPSGAQECIAMVNQRTSYLQNSISNNNGFVSTLENTYSAIKQASGTAQVVVIGYPYLFPTPGSQAASKANSHCLWLDGDAESVFSRFEVGQNLLDAAELEAAGEAGVSFLALDDVFSGQELCTGSSDINDLGTGSGAGHPTQQGQKVMAQYIANHLGYVNTDSGIATAAQRTAAATLGNAVGVPVVKVQQRVFSPLVMPETEVPDVSGSEQRPFVQAAADATLSVGQSVINGLVGQDFAGFLWVSGGQGAYSWAVTGGALPPGLTLDPSTGIISGVPTAPGSSFATVTVTDSSSPPLTASTTVKIAIESPPALSVQTTSLPAPTVDEYYNAQVVAVGGTPPYQWSVSTGALPGGLSLDATTGSISGIPNVPGPAQFTVTVSDSGVPPVTASEQFTLATVAAGEPLSAGPDLPAGATQGVEYNQPLTATGGTGPVYWSVVQGALPAGLALDPGTGLISGTPTGSGMSAFTVQVQDASVPTPQVATEDLSIAVSAAPALASDTTTLPDTQVGAAYDQVLDLSAGVPPYTWTVTSGALPDGLVLGPTSGTITGTPTVSGTFDFTATAYDSATPTANSLAFIGSITVAPGPTSVLAVTDTVTDGVVGTAYDASILPVGGTEPYGYALADGTLPPGLSLDPNAGTITGTPTDPGTYTAAVGITDNSSPPETTTDTVDISIAAAGPLAIATVSLPDAQAGSAYAQPIWVSGGVGADTFTVTSGQLPDGLTLDPDSGYLAGSPTTPGLSQFTVTVTDSNLSQADMVSQDYSLTVDSPANLTIPTTSLPDATQGSSYFQTVYGTGGTTPYTWSVISGTLPPGLTLDSSTGDMSGIPTDTGTYPFTIEATDSSPTPQIAPESLSLTVDPGSPLTILTTGLDPANEGATYSQTFVASGGVSPDLWSVVSGTLPPGLTLDPNAATLSGTATASGHFSFTVQVSDSSAPGPASAQEQLDLYVVPLAPTQTAIAVDPVASAPGGDVVYTAQVSSLEGIPTGTVLFSVAGAELCQANLSSGQGSCDTTDAPTGGDLITGNYSGDNTFAPSLGTASLTVGTGSTTTSSTVPTTTTSSTTTSSTVPTTTTSSTTTSSTVPTTGPAPVILRLRPSFGPPRGGTPVLIVGENLTRVEHIYFGAERARFFRLSSRGLLTFSPPGSGRVTVTVVTAAGSSTPTPHTTFAYLRTHVISSRSPAMGSVGTRASILGENFTRRLPLDHSRVAASSRSRLFGRAG